MKTILRHGSTGTPIAGKRILKLLLPLVAFWGLAVGTANADLRSNAASWLQAYRHVPPEYALSARVQSIFEKIKRVTGRAALRSKLFILDSDSEPWAIALQDGNIILTRGAIDIIYGASDESLAAKDARMAFVLGHELKHIIDNDFWHEVAYETFADGRNLDKLNRSEQNYRKKLELRADEDGFLLASLAGFDTREVFSSIGSTENFLSYWTTQTNTVSGSSHFNPNERIEFLKERLESLDSAVSYFKFGVGLAYFGRYEEARILLDEFYSIYPSEQVANNLGYVHVQLARMMMPPQLSHQFWFQGLLELDSGLPKDVRGVVVPMPKEAFENLEYATNLLEQSVKMNPVGIYNRLNLASAYLYLNRASAATDILQTIAVDRADDYVEALKSMSRMLSLGSTEQWDSNARKNLERLASDESADASILYNYANIAKALNQDAVAEYFWNRLALRFDQIPLRYQQMICKQIRKHDVCQKKANEFSVRDAGWNTTLNPGDNIDAKEVRKELRRWGKPFEERVSGRTIRIYRRDNGDSALVIDQLVELVSLRKHGIDFKEHLRDRNGPPQNEVEMGLGSIWSYGSQWSAFVRDNSVEEIWISRANQ